MPSLAHAYRDPDPQAPRATGLPFAGNSAGQVAAFDADEEIHGEGEPATHVYRVISGAVRTFTVLTDGRRQIEAFHFPGDVFGVDAEDMHRLSAEAICGTQLLMIKRSHIEAAIRTDCAAAHELWRWTARALAKARAQMLLLGRKSAMEKVASFLLEMGRAHMNRGMLELPMSRADIADYLGLTIETVSRTLSQLEREGAISLQASRRSINIADPSRLAVLTA